MEKNEILVIYGNNPAEMAMKIAEAAGLAGLIGNCKKRIGLKPNLVVSRPASEGATTHPEIAAGLIAYLKKNGFSNIAILEGSWVGDSTAVHRFIAVCLGVDQFHAGLFRERPVAAGGKSAGR